MPKRSPATEDEIYAAIGRALTTWGHVEATLGQVFSVAMNPRNVDLAERAYWAVISFEGRLKMTRTVLEERGHLAPFPEWDKIEPDLVANNKIRNKIAHGAVVNGARWKGLLTFPEWVLAPYYHSRKRPELLERIRKRKPDEDPKAWAITMDDRPKERFTLAQLKSFKNDFGRLGLRLSGFSHLVEQRACEQEGVPLAGAPENQRLVTALSMVLLNTHSLPKLPRIGAPSSGSLKV